LESLSTRSLLVIDDFWNHHVAKPGRICKSVECVDQGEIDEIENVSFGVQDHDQDLFVDFHRLDLCVETQLTDYFLLQVVPYDHFICRPFRRVATAYESDYIGFIDHFSDRDTAVKISFDYLL